MIIIYFFTLLFLVNTSAFSAELTTQEEEKTIQRFKTLTLSKKPLTTAERENLYHQGSSFLRYNQYEEAEKAFRTLQEDNGFSCRLSLPQALLYQEKDEKIKEGFRVLIEDSRRGCQDSSIILGDINSGSGEL